MRKMRPNVRAKRGTGGGTPGPGYRKCTLYLWPGPGGPPLVLRLSEGLGVIAVARELRATTASVEAVACDQRRVSLAPAIQPGNRAV
jgi:hypothetical protein